MAITLKEIREKDFTRQVRGFATNEVEDFLDDIADQMEALLRENRALSQKVAELENGAPVQAAPAPVAESAKDDSAYFRSLENTLRETLLNAQRSANETVTAAQQTAEETVAAARKQAEDTVAAAQMTAEETVAAAKKQAEDAVSEAQAQVESLKAETDALRAAAESYRQNFLALVQEQAAVLKTNEVLF